MGKNQAQLLTPQYGGTRRKGRERGGVRGEEGEGRRGRGKG